MSRNLPIVEIVGPTVQGEGPHSGRRAVLIRLGGCNLSCGSCDTRYAWDGSESVAEVANGAIIDHLLEMAGKDQQYSECGYRQFRLAVITGGEPLIHQRNENLRKLVLSLLAINISVEVETNGTFIPARWFEPHLNNGRHVPAISFVVSPKILGGLATDTVERRIKPTALEWFRDYPYAIFKLVCYDPADVRRLGEWLDLQGIPRHRVWVMGEGSVWADHIARTRVMVERILEEGMNVSTRTHLALWPSATRGR